MDNVIIINDKVIELKGSNIDYEVLAEGLFKYIPNIAKECRRIDKAIEAKAYNSYKNTTNVEKQIYAMLELKAKKQFLLTVQDTFARWYKYLPEDRKDLFVRRYVKHFKINDRRKEYYRLAKMQSSFADFIKRTDAFDVEELLEDAVVKNEYVRAYKLKLRRDNDIKNKELQAYSGKETYEVCEA